MSYAELKKRKLSDYKYLRDYRLRWSVTMSFDGFILANTNDRLDNDMYQHMNNNVYGMLYAKDP